MNRAENLDAPWSDPMRKMEAYTDEQFLEFADQCLDTAKLVAATDDRMQALYNASQQLNVMLIAQMSTSSGLAQDYSIHKDSAELKTSLTSILESYPEKLLVSFSIVSRVFAIPVIELPEVESVADLGDALHKIVDSALAVKEDLTRAIGVLTLSTDLRWKRVVRTRASMYIEEPETGDPGGKDAQSTCEHTRVGSMPPEFERAGALGMLRDYVRGVAEKRKQSKGGDSALDGPASLN